MSYPKVSLIAQAKIDRAFFRAARADALTQQRGRCAYCKERLTASSVTADHMFARARGGNDNRDNILAACFLCNNAKGKRRIGEFKNLIKNPPRDARIGIRSAWMRRKLNKRIEAAERRILASVGLAP
jgi:hypothetical protein